MWSGHPIKKDPTVVESFKWSGWCRSSRRRMSRTNQVCSQLLFSVSVEKCVRAHDVIRASHKKKTQLSLSLLNGRDDMIRTCDPLVPSEVRYQAALHPDIFNCTTNKTFVLLCALPLSKKWYLIIFSRQNVTSRYLYYTPKLSFLRVRKKNTTINNLLRQAP